MSRLAELPPAGRVVVVVMLTVLAMTLLITLENRARNQAQAAPVPAAASPHRADLSRCRALGEAAGGDHACQAVWADNRARFFGSGERRAP